NIPHDKFQEIQLLIENHEIKLMDSNYSGIDNSDVNRKKLTIKDELSILFGSLINSPNIIKIVYECIDSKIKLNENGIIPIWDCRIIFQQLSDIGEYIASGTIIFSIDKRNWKLYPQSLRWF
ncbi:MAG: hypothetical protein GY865_12300, partial [candidate division Zixibacteria bacterium]|nr:hypothetical protein [candidate division Zixibacteria bacterium]